MSFLLIRRFATPKREPNAVPKLFGKLAFGNVTVQLAKILPQSNSKLASLKKELIAAGYFHHTAVDNFLAKRNVALMTLICGVVFLFAIGIADGLEIYFAIGGSIACVFVYSLPRVVVSSTAKKRSQAIEKATPDALDMIAITCASGMPLSSSIGRVAEQMHKSHPDLATELKIIYRQCQSGSIDQAFSSFAKRIDLPEIVAWSSLMRQSQRLGGTIVDALSDYANRIREDRKNRMENAGNAASIKLLLPVVLCLAPPIGILLIGPALLDFRDFMKREGDTRAKVVEQLNSQRERSRSLLP